MQTSKGFDPYEVTGIIIPGTVLTLLFAAEAPPFRSMLGSEGLTVGDLGLFVLIAFVLGHLVQALGNLVEFAVWPKCGLPTNLVLLKAQLLVSPAQRTTLQICVTKMEGQPTDISRLDRNVWRAITTRAYARVRTAGRSMRIDIANRNYGLCRGLVAALIIVLLWCICFHRDELGLLAMLALMIVAAVWRMRRAGIHYARALFLEFIDLEQ